MKKLLILLFFPLSLLAQQRDSVYVKSPIFELMYSEKYKEPLWVKYKVQCPNGTASRAGMDFYTNDSIKTSTAADYINNVYDKGHMAPAASFSCTREMLLQTFSYLNCALQNQYLNRGVWRILEEHERELARTEPVNVKIVVVINSTSITLPSGAKVPVGFYKYVYLEKSKKTFTYYFPNDKPTLKSYSDYEIKK